MSPDDFSDFDREVAAARTDGDVRTTPSPDTPDYDRAAGAPRSRVKVGNVSGAFAAVLGLEDTITFGYLDEMVAYGDSLPWYLGGKGTPYEENLRYQRELMKAAQEQHPYIFGGAQVAGAFVPALGWAGRAKTVATGAKALDLTSLVRAGAAQGALYGSGSAEGDTWTDRFMGAAGGAAAGALGGFVLGAVVAPVARAAIGKATAVFRWGKPVRVAPEFKFEPAKADNIVGKEAGEVAAIRKETGPAPQRAPETKPAGLKPVDEGSKLWNDVTGTAAAALEKDAVVSGKELFGMTRQAAKTAILNRISKLTPQQAARMAKSLEKAEASGDLLADPQYRSILGIDLTGSGMTDEAIHAAAVTLEEATEALNERAGFGKQTAKSIDAQFRSYYGTVSHEGDLDQAIERAARGVTDTRLGNMHMAMAAMQFQRAKAKYLPLVLKGDKEARDKLAEELSTAIRVSAKGRIIISAAGRALGDLSRAKKLAFTEMKDGVAQIEDPASIKARVDTALKELGDSDLAELLGRVRGMDALDQVEEVLLNPEHAKNLSTYRRAMNSLGLYLKSNSLTPASGLFNTVGFVLHDAFRNGWAKKWAAAGLERAGQASEAAMLRFEVAASNRVYWEAHRRGLRAMLNRVQWEWWDSVEKIAGVATADSKLALKATTSKQALMANGFEAPAIREFDRSGRAAVTDIKGFNQRIETMQAEGGAFANIVGNLQRAGAASLNTVDALGTATARLVSGALDDWGSTFVRVKETYALSARQAMREALQTGLPQDEMAEWASKRAKTLAEMPTSGILESVEEKLMNHQQLSDADHFLLRLRDNTDKEASAVLFTDGPQTEIGRQVASLATKVDRAVSLGTVEGLLFRYIRTPTRIFERGLVSYTPWAGKAQEVQAILAKGGVEAEIEKARMEIGAFVMGIGAIAASTGAITLTNGGWKNSENLKGSPPDRLNLPGGGHIELGRLDPFALTLALGGFIGQAIHSYRKDRSDGYEAEEALHTAFNIAWLSVRESVLEKSYLTGLRDVMKGAFADDGDGMAGAYAKMFEGAITNLAPFSGTVRQVQDTIHGTAPESVSWIDKMLRTVPGLGLGLPARIDALGDPVEGRFMGIDADAVGDNIDPVKAQLADLGIDLTQLQRADPSGFKLNSEELSELRRLRGHEATNSDGLTMREALADLFADPAFKGLRTRDQKHDAVSEVMSGFNESARALFEERNPAYLADRTAMKSLADYMEEGLAPDEAKTLAIGDTKAMGLPAPTRLP